jgi:hypothetical protein
MSVWATPIVVRQNSSRAGFTSSTMIFALVSLANSNVAKPMGPAPRMRHVSSLFNCARSTAWQPIAKVSTRASCSKPSVRETCSLRAGTVNKGRKPPSQCTPSV